MQIIVLGMHRSGSSLLTRLINMMGAYLSGEDKIMPPKPDNPKGFWEREDVYKLNERILRSGGGNWMQVVDFDWETIDAETHAGYLEEARRILAGLDANRPWVVKDPRLCITFPLWRELLEVPICVHLHRNPVEIAQSLAQRNGLPISVGVGLWELYALSAIKVSRDLPSIWINQADLLAQPVATTEALFQELHRLGAGGLRLPTEREITAFIDPALFHHRQNAQQEQSHLNQRQARLAALIAAGAGLEALDDEPSAGGIEAQRLHFAGEAARDTVATQEREIATLTDAKQQLEQQRLADRERLEARLADETNRHRHREAELEAQIQHASTVRANLEARSQELGIRLDSERTQAQRLLDKVTGLAHQIGDLSTTKKALESRCGGAERQRDACHQQQQQLSERHRHLEQLHRHLEQLHHHLEQMHRAQAERLSQTDRHIRHLARDISATRQSWRWRIGNAAVRTAEVMLLRRPPRLGMDQIQETLQAALSLQQTPLARPQHQPRRDPPPASTPPANTPPAIRAPAAPPATPTVAPTPSSQPTPEIFQLTPANPRNPFYTLVGSALTAEGFRFHYTTDRASVLDAVRAHAPAVVVHLHQLEPFYHAPNQTAEALAASAEALLDFLRELKRRGAKLVWTKHNPVPHQREHRALDESVEHQAMQLMDRVVVLSEGAKRQLANNLDARRIHVIRHPSYRTLYGEPPSQAAARERLGIPADAHVFGNIGELKPYKGLEQIIAAFSQFRETPAGQQAYLLLAGNPGPPDYLRDLEQALPAQARLVAKDIPSADIPTWVSALDTAVFAFRDIWVSGSVVLALSYERPVLVPDIGFLDEYVDEENTGLLYAPNSAQGLYDAMTRIAATPYRAHYAYMCRVFEKKHRIDRIARQYADLYASL